MPRLSEGGEVVSVDRQALIVLCLTALGAAGADRRVAELLTEAALFAEDRGKTVAGVAHLLDHIDAMDDGRLDGRAVPRLAQPFAAVITSDACGGIAQTGFDEGFSDFTKAARSCGLAAFAQHGSFTCGPLGWFTERLANAGLIAVATAVSPALMAAGPGTGPVFGTNPLAYSVPRVGGVPLTVDQASSSTAFVSVRDAAARGVSLPEGWAVDAEGNPTTDSEAALKGALLPFGGYKGANVALLVELLSAMAGGNWSVDAPPWDSGSRSPAIGMFVLAVDHSAMGGAFPVRVTDYLNRLVDSGVQLSGRRRTTAPSAPTDHIELRAEVVEALRRRAGGNNTRS